MDDSAAKRGAIKGTLRVKGQTNRSTVAPRADLPAHCERCQKKTLGSLQLPCGRQVRLCEACSLEFYDILMGKIAQCDTEFQDFLREQKRKEARAAKEKEQSQHGRSRSTSISNVPKVARHGRTHTDNGDSRVDGGNGNEGTNGDRLGSRKDVFIPINRSQPQKESIQMPSLNGASVGGNIGQRRGTTSGGRGPPLSLHTGDRPSTQYQEMLSNSPTSPRIQGSPTVSKQRWAHAQPAPLRAGSMAEGGETGSPSGSSGGSPNGRLRTGLTRHGSGGSVGSNGSAGSRGGAVGASQARRHSAQMVSGGMATTLRSSEIRDGSRVAVGGKQRSPGGKIQVAAGPFGPRGVGVGPLIVEPGVIKAAPQLARDASAREIQKKLGAMGDLLATQTQRA